MTRTMWAVIVLSVSLAATGLSGGTQAATADHLTTVQKAYLGYYQRPADPGGLLYWADRLDRTNGNLDAIIEAFANSDESRALYGRIDGSSIGRVVDAIYTALFNRAAEPAGKTYYVNGFNGGRFTAATIMLNILHGAQNQDALSVANKVAAANAFTRTIDPELDGRDFLYSYSGCTSAVRARQFVSAVTADFATVPTWEATRAFFPVRVLTEADDHATVSLPQGALLQVELPQTPSTGFAWYVDPLNQSVLELASQGSCVPEGVEGGLPGTSETKYYLLRGVAAGTATFSLAYYQWWVGVDSNTKRFSVLVDVGGEQVPFRVSDYHFVKGTYHGVTNPSYLLIRSLASFQSVFSVGYVPGMDMSKLITGADMQNGFVLSIIYQGNDIRKFGIDDIVLKDGQLRVFYTSEVTNPGASYQCNCHITVLIANRIFGPVRLFENGHELIGPTVSVLP
jgi:predicted secreted protein